MLTLLLLVLGQTSSTTIADPTIQSKKVTTTTSGGKQLLDINCVSGCTAGGGGSATYIDGGVIGVLQFQSRDGGTDWPTEAKITQIGSSTVGAVLPVGFDGGFVTAIQSGTWAIQFDAGLVTAVQGLGEDGGRKWNNSCDIDRVAGTFIGGVLPVGFDGGPVTCNAGTNLNTSALALDATLTGGTTKAIVRGGAKGATTAADVTSTANGVDHQGLDVQIQGTPTVTATGTVTANAGTNLNTSALALSATQTDRTQKTQITDGTRDGTVKAGSTAAQAADTSVVVALHPTSPLPAGSNVIGHVVADTGSTTTVTGNVTVVQPTGTNLHTVLDTTSTTAVTQATGTNLHAVLDTTSTTAVTQATAGNLNATVVQATGGNLHVAVDSAPTTAVTAASLPLPTNAAQETGGNLAAISYALTSGAAKTQVTNLPLNLAKTAVSVDPGNATRPVNIVGPVTTNQAVDPATNQGLVQIMQPVVVFQVPSPFPMNPFLPRCNLVRRLNCQP